MPGDFDLIRIASGKNRSSLRWAEFGHRGVMRKGAPFGYVTHVVAVATVMAGAGGDRNLVVACDLHDLVEDTQHLPDIALGTSGPDGQWLPRRFTIDDVRLEFGYSVSRYVEVVTKGPEMKGVRLEDQAQIIVAKLLSLVDDGDVDDPYGGVKVKACDLLVNMSDLVFDAENDGVAHYAEIFGAARAERKIRHYLRLAELLEGILRERQVAWDRLADALRFRADELRVLVDRFATDRAQAARELAAILADAGEIDAAQFDAAAQSTMSAATVTMLWGSWDQALAAAGR